MASSNASTLHGNDSIVLFFVSFLFYCMWGKDIGHTKKVLSVQISILLVGFFSFFDCLLSLLFGLINYFLDLFVKMVF